MRKVIVSEYVTLDGVMEDPGGLNRFKDGNWHFPFWDEETHTYKFEELFASDALLLGRVTYQEFAAAWPFRTDEEGFADRMNGLPKYVVSTTLSEVTWHNSRLIKANVAEAVSSVGTGTDAYRLRIGTRTLELAPPRSGRRGVAGL